MIAKCAKKQKRNPKVYPTADLPKPMVVQLKPNHYQPTKAELEASIDIRKADGRCSSLDEFVSILFRPKCVVTDPDS